MRGLGFEDLERFKMSTRIEPGEGNASDTFNKKMMPLEGPYKNRAARVAVDGEFSNADRAWRKKFLKDQHLSEADGIMAQVRCQDIPK